ncbi:MAG TPA: single-stranded DNA-binding protein [Candidatus Limiplasma sp.]|nr:single-stranded DNA-binding protein [Candidatus Limiplasma sp.]
MNKLTIIGNLTRDPETRTVASGSTVCSFTLAVNRRRSSQNNNQPDADFFRVSAWNKLGEVCQRYLAKGRKVCVVGNVSVSSYEAKDGTTRFSLDVYAEDVEFLSPRSEGSAGGGAYAPSDADDSGSNSGFQEVDDDDLPF